VSKGISCKCPEKQKPVEERDWAILQYKHNRSAFNGYEMTPSEYSSLHCNQCRASWRTKAEYVHRLDMSREAIY
jgi:hypothetical protein